MRVVAIINGQVGGRLDFCGHGGDSFMIRMAALMVAAIEGQVERVTRWGGLVWTVGELGKKVAKGYCGLGFQD